LAQAPGALSSDSAMSLSREKKISRSVADLGKMSVPFLPGHRSVENLALTRTNHRRPQTLIYKLDSATEKIATKPVPLDKNTLAAMSLGATRAQTAPGSSRSQSLPRLTKPAKNTYRPAIEPAWLKHDRQCLRFYAYFQEHVVENPKENFRIRCVVVTYFLEDGTMQITEQKVENSGIFPQGPFVKRHRIPNAPDGGYWAPEHLKMGTSITIYGRTFRVVDADPFTKWFYDNAGMDIGTEEEQPTDTFLDTEVWKKESLVKNQGLPRDVMEGKAQNEKKMGGGGNNRGLKQFLENDRKVLRFYGYWDDKTRYGARWYFTIHYFLADDTVEINNMYMRNVGKWLVPSFFKRGKLPLFPQTVAMPGMISAPSPILLPKDIEVGKTIPVYGREVFIYDCDDATADFYEKYMGKRPEKVEVPEEKYQHKTLLPPPWNGLGAEQDTLNGVKQVTERARPHRDMTKLFMYGNKALRFEAVPENNVPEDAHRKWLIEYFLADNTILVGERHIRNSGCWDGGKYKERDLPGGERRTINPDTGRPFEAHEFYVGALVNILYMPMRIIRADEWSLKFMETDPVTWPQSSMVKIAKKLKDVPESAAKWPRALAPEDLRDEVENLTGVELNDQELITVLRCTSEDDTAMVDTEKLCAVLRKPPLPPPPEPRPGDPLPEIARPAAAA